MNKHIALGLLLAPIMLVGCVTAPRDQFSAPRCQIHDVPLQVGVSPILYGLVNIGPPPTGDYHPNADGIVLGGCMRRSDAPDFAVVLYCPECRQNDPKWRKGEVQDLWQRSAAQRAQRPSRPMHMEMEVLFVELNNKSDIIYLTDGLSAEALMGLVEKGKAAVLSAPVARTQPGQEVTVKVVKEFIYPTTFEFRPLDGKTNVLQTGTMLVQPGSFETREVGTILSVMLDVGPSTGTIRVVATPELVSNPEWKEYGSQYKDPSGATHIASIQQPFFHTITFNADLVVQDGKPVLLGGGMPSQNKDKIVYGILTARIVKAEKKSVEQNTGHVRK